MRRANILLHNRLAGFLEEEGRKYRFTYCDGYDGPPVSLTMPTAQTEYLFDAFPPFLEGLLPEGVMLEGLLRQNKLSAGDYLGQAIAVGHEMVGAITVEEASE